MSYADPQAFFLFESLPALEGATGACALLVPFGLFVRSFCLRLGSSVP
jgi:hypothetical protein